MDDLPSITWIETAMRIIAAAISGAAIGLNRDLHGKPIGVRTLGVVAVACSTLTVAAIQFGEQAGDLSAETMGRATQGLMAGIGFLGGGVILRTSSRHIEGLTTAALVWLTAALGVACGVGAWRAVSMALGATFVLLLFGGMAERVVHRLFDHGRRMMGSLSSPPNRVSRDKDSL